MTTDGPPLDAEDGQGLRSPTSRRLLTLLALMTAPPVSASVRPNRIKAWHHISEQGFTRARAADFIASTVAPRYKVLLQKRCPDHGASH